MSGEHKYTYGDIWGARHGFTEARMTGDATHLHWYNRSISSYLRRGRFFTAFPGNDTNEYVLLLFPPLGRGVALALDCEDCAERPGSTA